MENIKISFKKPIISKKLYKQRIDRAVKLVSTPIIDKKLMETLEYLFLCDKGICYD